MEKDTGKQPIEFDETELKEDPTTTPEPSNGSPSSLQAGVGMFLALLVNMAAAT